MSDLFQYAVFILAGASVLLVVIFALTLRFIDGFHIDCRSERILDELQGQLERGAITRQEYEEWSRIIGTFPLAP